MAAFGGGNPFATGGNPFGGGGLKGGLGMLKKKAKPKSFEELEILVTREEQWKKNATARMREIDTFRLHVPEAGERSQFSIPESTDRVNAQDQKHLMVLCGGYAGVRFTTEELALIRTRTKELSDSFTRLDSYFKALPNTVKRISLSPEVIARCSCPLTEAKDRDGDGDGDGIKTGGDKDNDEVVLEEVQLKEVRLKEDAAGDERAVVCFHGLADEVHEVLGGIQGLVKKKHAEFTAAQELVSGSLPDGALSQDQQDGEGEESMSSLPRPVWLETLLCKYTQEVILLTTTTTTSSSSTSSSTGLPPVGSLCAFLSCCAIRQVATTKAEEEAMQELIQASSDLAGRSSEDLSLNMDDEIFCHTQKYWAQRFFVFMKKLTELKTAMKDEKSLFLFEKFIL